jgi:hypothetical protein
MSFAQVLLVTVPQISGPWSFAAFMLVLGVLLFMRR